MSAGMLGSCCQLQKGSMLPTEMSPSPPCAALVSPEPAEQPASTKKSMFRASAPLLCPAQEATLCQDMIMKTVATVECTLSAISPQA